MKKNEIITKTLSVAWLSRHPVTPEQLGDLTTTLCRDLGVEEVEVMMEDINHTWQASSDKYADGKVNAIQWKHLLEAYDVICGVFPQAN